MEGGAEGIKAFPNRVFLNDLRELVCYNERIALGGEEGPREVACASFGLAPNHWQNFGISQLKLQRRPAPYTAAVAAILGALQSHQCV